MTPLAISRFATFAAKTRAESYGGSAENATADRDGNNLQLGARKFRAPFADEFGREITEHGEKVIVGATVLVRDALGLTIAQGAELTHLGTNQVYVVETITRSGASVERRLHCRRLEV